MFSDFLQTVQELYWCFFGEEMPGQFQTQVRLGYELGLNEIETIELFEYA